ncbi:MAG: hydantoinase/oxoprolinase family protein [Rhizobiaceae bacterium]|nr:hydantoinase/oxoprolinase family protein [Rhizobiaceae bacterium]
MRFSVDTGGTFTDLIVEGDDGALRMFKAATNPANPILGVIEALKVAADGYGLPLADLLARGEMFIYGTTHAINAIITGNTARTAFLTSQGHPDILVLREGGRVEPFNFQAPFPDPYVPRALTFEIPGRLMVDGSERTPFDDDAAIAVIDEMKARGVAAVAVCLIWSIVNADHEKRMAALLDEHMPGVPYTLSHVLNPTLREYRRASSTCIDASLKPMMQAYMRDLTHTLAEAGFGGRVLVVTSQGGVMDAAEVANSPIHLINSGPSMAPVSGRYFSNIDEDCDTAIIADTGGTTYDVSLVRRNRIPWTRETWIGQPYRGHMTGFPSVDVKSIGAGGGSIAWVDEGGMLHVGPKSAGAVPGPVCYGQGGELPTVTDASLALGYIDPAFFLGGTKTLDLAAARAAIETKLAKPLGLSIEEAAAAVIRIATENMVQAIIDITVNQGIDPRDTVLVGGGGAAGLNSVLIARRLESRRLLIPEVGAALSAAGAMMSDLTSTFHKTLFTRTSGFDFAGVNGALTELRTRCDDFVARYGTGVDSHTIRFSAEARYPEQVWEIEIPLPVERFASAAELRALEDVFHKAHDDIFAISDPGSPIEIVGWTASVACRLRGDQGGSLALSDPGKMDAAVRMAYFPGHGSLTTAVHRFEAMKPGEQVAGPAIIESSFTTVVVNPGAVAERRPSGSLSIDPGRD